MTTWNEIEREFKEKFVSGNFEALTAHKPAHVLAFFKDRTAPIKDSKHTLHSGLVSALRTFGELCVRRKQAGWRNWNHVHLRRDLGERLSRDAENNFSKLGFIGLVEHWGRGDWGLSEDGIKFLKGELRVQEGVMTRRKDKKTVVVRRFGKSVGIHDFKDERPKFEADAPVDVTKLLQQPLINPERVEAPERE